MKEPQRRKRYRKSCENIIMLLKDKKRTFGLMTVMKYTKCHGSVTATVLCHAYSRL
jgi:hypothetical protein